MSARWLPLACVAACGSNTTMPGSTDAPASGSGSSCTAAGTMLTCAAQSVQLDGRTVTYALPVGTPPAAGWPTVVFYQGSFIAGSHAFAAAMADSFGQYQLTKTVQALLDHGYAVVAPNAGGDGSLYWQTNVPPSSTSWTGCDDDVLVHDLLAAIADHTFGPLDPDHQYAMGISSGGFMTSRMAVSYQGKFRALAIASASYATCGMTCSVPALPADHPPTLFLHGNADHTVPVSAMTPYHDALVADGRTTDAIINPDAGHEWLPEAVSAVPVWFDEH
jgi:poly(3-hydroxybutyrate) depolymerase